MLKTIKGYSIIVLFLAVFVLLGSCSENRVDDPGLKENRVIENRYPENNKIELLKLEETLNISSDIVPDQESVIFTDFERDKNGTVYLVDNSNIHVYIFDKSGKFKGKFLRKGNGPGEFIEYPKIRLTENFLWIKGEKKIGKFRKNGEFIKEFRLKNYYDLLMIVDDGNFLGSRDTIDRKRKGGFGKKLLALFSLETEEIKEKYCETYEAGRYFVKLGKRYAPVYPDAGIVPDIAYTYNLSSETILYSESRSYKVYIKGLDNKLISEFSLDYEPPLITDQGKKGIVESFNKVPENLKKLVYDGIPKRFASIRSITTLPNSNVIVMSLISIDESNFDVFDLEGNFIKRFRIDLGFKPDGLKFINGILCVVEDNGESYTYHEYKISDESIMFTKGEK
ncbi:MAG: 6-bladed beta-propeller [Candidatus Aminicenantes bacterium]|nr:6-bladed beta-propeller [Candidatus Aminicenantes bacterium]